MPKYNYIPTTSTYLVEADKPFDAKTIVSLKTDLLDASKFGADPELHLDYRYKGMIVAVVHDTPEKNGIYAYSGSDPDSIDSWSRVDSDLAAENGIKRVGDKFSLNLTTQQESKQVLSGLKADASGLRIDDEITWHLNCGTSTQVTDSVSTGA